MKRKASTKAGRWGGMPDRRFWKGRRVFITGHTGFKGSWLCLWLHSLGARVSGYARQPPTKPSLFELARVGGLVRSTMADVSDVKALSRAMKAARPEVVIHLAARAIVRDSYRDPVATYATNVMGTVNLLEAVRGCGGVRAVVNVTSDKCYENQERARGYREHEPMGGYDPYSSSKGCSELVTAAYRRSFFNPDEYESHGVAVATARAGNVIGGGDWAPHRLVPDCVRAILSGRVVYVRNPDAIRPWQYVLEPLRGYLALAQALCEVGPRYGAGWNFGPDSRDARSVGWLIQELCERWGGEANFEVDLGKHPHEAHYLKLDCAKARAELGWYPRWNLGRTLDRIVEWTQAYARSDDMRRVCLRQIDAYSTPETKR